MPMHRLLDAALTSGARALSPLINPHARTDQRRLTETVAGKVVLVTGASYGIGEATARKLAGAGATVLLVARSEDRLERLRAEIAQAGGGAFAYPTDLSDPDAVASLATRLLEDHGQVDVVVSNAGKSIRRSVEMSYERFQDYERTIGINYLGPVRLLLALLPSMRERGTGQIVNVSTIGVLAPPTPRWSAYLASKSAFDVFLRSAATEVRADGVAVTSVYMGLVHTRMSAPTPIWRYVPGQTPEQAADAICAAIVTRPRRVAVWWAPFAEAALSLARGPWEVLAGLEYRLTPESRASARAADLRR
jgi:NAD(P)-dependent dehydrogenase (short-subunit alcohol dehydrogenase family)